MNKLTYQKFISLPNHEKTKVYFAEWNSVSAQSAFVNDWRNAFAIFANTLPF